MDKLRVGIVGTGRISDLHYLGYQRSSRADVYAISDADESLLQSRAQEWGVERTYSDYRQLLEDPNVDAVDIVTPHHLHAEMTIAALEAGKHVSVQKPMALDIAQADAMVAVAGRSDKLFRVIDNYLFHTPYVRAKELIDGGEIGEPISLSIKTVSGFAPEGWDIPQSSHEWRTDPARSGAASVLFDHGQHIWAIVTYLLGDVERVFAYIGRTEVDQHHELETGAVLDSPALVTWKYASGDIYGSCEAVHAEQLMVHSTHYPIDVRLEITGSKGIVAVNQGPPGKTLDRPTVEVYRDGATRSFSDFDAGYATSFVTAVNDFVDAIGEGRQSRLTGTDARHVLRMSLAILRSGKEQCEVRLDQITS